MPASVATGVTAPVVLTLFLSLIVFGATLAVTVVATTVAVGVGVGVPVVVGVGDGDVKPWQPGEVPQALAVWLVLARMAVAPPWQLAQADGGGGVPGVAATWQVPQGQPEWFDTAVEGVTHRAVVATAADGLERRLALAVSATSRARQVRTARPRSSE